MSNILHYRSTATDVIAIMKELHAPTEGVHHVPDGEGQRIETMTLPGLVLDEVMILPGLVLDEVVVERVVPEVAYQGLRIVQSLPMIPAIAAGMSLPILYVLPMVTLISLNVLLSTVAITTLRIS